MMVETAAADTRGSVRADEVEAIRQLKARYFRGVDTRDWALLRAVFTEDAKIGPMENGLPPHVLAVQQPMPPRSASASDVDAFMERVAAFLSGVVSVHHGHQSEISLTGDDEAEGVWAMEDVLVWPKSGYRFRGAGHYWETYRKIAGEWRISSTRLTRLYVYTEDFAPAG
jgi:hypothetical protein